MTFHGRFRGGEGHHGHGHGVKLEEVHESPLTMLVPLGVLALGALVAGAIFAHFYIGADSSGFWRGAVAIAYGHAGGRELPLWVEFAPFAVTLLGFAIAYYYYILNPELPAQLAAKKGMLYTFVYNKWYFDELYAFLFVRPAMRVGRFLWKVGDGSIIDGLGPDGVAARVLDATRGAIRLQSGYVYHYAFAMLIGVVALTTWFVVGAP
jgi:NADH-quinone oxidoreductase subunit L